MWVRGLKRYRENIIGIWTRSHPMWVRGLKLKQGIELTPQLRVAPYVGAWIETNLETFFNYQGKSHPMWVRGLKLNSDTTFSVIDLSHPMWVRGLKHSYTACKLCCV